MSIYGPVNQPKSGVEAITTIPAAAVVTVLAAANPARGQGSYIMNNSNKIMWVSWGALPLTAAAPFTPVPANGGEIDFPGDFTGVVQGIWIAGATGSSVVHEFTTA
jgi:hypothetical protein